MQLDWLQGLVEYLPSLTRVQREVGKDRARASEGVQAVLGPVVGGVRLLRVLLQTFHSVSKIHR